MKQFLLPLFSILVIMQSCKKSSPENVKATAPWEQVAGLNAPMNSAMQTLHEDNLNRIWVGTDDSGLYMFDGGNWKHFSGKDDPIGIQLIRSLSSIMMEMYGSEP